MPRRTVRAHRATTALDLDGVRLYLGTPESPTFRSTPVLYISVEDIDEAYAVLRGRGLEFAGTPHLVHRGEGSELWMAFFRDPDGTNLAIMAERPA